MGRANVYLPDDLERRVKAARIPVSEVCQRALLAAVEAAESEDTDRIDAELRGELDRGRAAGLTWAQGAPPAQLLTLVRDGRLDGVPPDALPDDFYSLTAEQSLAWEAGFSVAALEAARRAVRSPGARSDHPTPDEGASDGGPGKPQSPFRAPTGADGPRLGDDAGARIGTTLDGDAVLFDPHAAVRAGKSPLFAVLGQPDLRARLTLSLAQDAAARGTAVVILDVSGQLSSRARGLGRNVRVVRPERPAMPSMPSLDDLTRGGVGLGGLLEMLTGLAAGSGLGDLFSGPQVPPPGHVTVVDSSGNGLSTALALAQAAHLLSQLNSPADHPRLVHIDLPTSVSLPGPLGAAIGRLLRTARERNAALGLSADSAQLVSEIGAKGSLLSTAFAFATSNPAEADRLRHLLGAAAPILLNPPGSTPTADEPTWVVMRDLEGRLGQVRLDSW